MFADLLRCNGRQIPFMGYGKFTVLPDAPQPIIHEKQESLQDQGHDRILKGFAVPLRNSVLVPTADTPWDNFG